MSSGPPALPQGPTNPAIAFNFPNGGPSGDLVSNPAHFNGDFLGAAGTGGGSAVITLTFNSPVSNVGIRLADVDVSESYVLSTFDPANDPIASVTVSSGMSGTGDGVATDVSISALFGGAFALRRLRRQRR
jgi:hypothetical protein